MHVLTSEQVQGAEFLADRERALLADEVGFGKTVQVLEAARLISARRIIYVTGAQASYQVVDEVGKFSMPFTVKIVRGPKKYRETVYANPPNLIVLGYETFRNDATLLNQQEWDLIVLDDASKFKNTSSNLSIAANLVTSKARYAWALTATPIETALENLWAIFHAINFYPLGSYEDFSIRYCLYDWRRIRRRREWTVVKYQNIADLKARIAPHILRRINTKGPSLVLMDHKVGMYPQQFHLYNAARGGAFGPTIHDRFTKALMFCDSTIFSDDECEERSTKIDTVMELVQALPNKIVIYSMWKKVLKHLKKRFLQAGISWVEISGDVPISKRNDNQRRFHRDPSLKVCLVTRAAEQALNLQAAQYMICINRLANPKRMEQVWGRIKRTGSPFSQIFVVNLVVQGSIEEAMIELSESRAQLSAEVLGEETPERFSTNEMFQILARSNEMSILLEDGTTADPLPYVDIQDL